MKTRSGLPKYCSFNTDRHGTRRVMFRRRGFATYLSGIPWSEDFMRRYAIALGGTKPDGVGVGATQTATGSLNSLIVSYYRSPEFLGLRASTQVMRRGIIERLRKHHGTKPVAMLARSHIMKLIGEKSDTPNAANNLLKVLRLLMGYGVSLGMLSANPVLGVKGYKISGDGNHTWTEDEIARFEATHPIGTSARLALALLLYTAQRRGDVVKMGWQHIQGTSIVVRQEKTDTPLLLPILPQLAEVLACLPKTNLTFLLSRYGKPFHPTAFSNWFRVQCDKAGLPDCSAHGLRKAASTRLANDGRSMHEIAAITGHKTLGEVQRYTKAADQVRLARSAMDSLGAKGRTKIAQPALTAVQKLKKDK